MIITHGSEPGSQRATPMRPVALTIGNFDGVHRGHQFMIARTIEVARERGIESCALTFEPHPREYFAGDGAPTRLTSLREKTELLAELGIGRVHVQRFTAEFAQLPPAGFIEHVLRDTLQTRWILVGDDFRFGAKRAGDHAQLKAAGPRCGFEVETMPTVQADGVRISSSAVRAALLDGELERAKLLLGRPYSISGRVIHGEKLGRTLGFATANIALEHNRPPLMGIFVVRVRGLGERSRNAVASLGYRPTVTDEKRALLEVHLFDFNADIYGQLIRVEFLHKLRDEEKYPDLDTLKAAIARDCVMARDYFEHSPHG